jgi:hypothetical protein
VFGGVPSTILDIAKVCESRRTAGCARTANRTRTNFSGKRLIGHVTLICGIRNLTSRGPIILNTSTSHSHHFLC